MKNSSKTKDNIKTHLFNHINAISGEGFLVNEIKSDAEPSFVAIKNDLNRIGVKLTIGTPGNKNTTVPALDRRIRTLKERVRCILHDLDYHLPQILLKECSGYVVTRMNLIRSSLFTMLSPREIYTGIKTDVNRDIRLSFGSIVQVPVSTTSNNMEERTNTCISLTPTMNNNGSIKFYVLKNGETIIRGNWTQIPITESIIKWINKLSNNKNKLPCKSSTHSTLSNEEDYNTITELYGPEHRDIIINENKNKISTLPTILQISNSNEPTLSSTSSSSLI